MTARHLERVEWAPYPDVDLEVWPFTVPVVRQLIAEGGLEIPNPLASPAGFFLRAELLHDYLDRVDRDPRQRRAWGTEPLLDRSHGETFLEVLRQRFAEPGFYLIDEPEAALSFTGCLGLIALLGELANAGSQALVATHSPLVASVPGATIWELDDEGRHEIAWEDTELVRSWRAFLDEPQRYLRHLSG
ncbi:MAG: hypothetical protein LC679_19350 [Intrasporangiaceae bacterium]|nr:hypothetical protein [Intrasporangiaceae bacterium]